MSQLPIEGVLPELLLKLDSHQQIILKAAPGAGKSTFLPLTLLKQRVIDGKIIMLEPRRLAAKNIACYLAKQLGEQVGERVGFRVRGESRVSANTQLEIVTEGIMTRMIQQDPELTGVSLLIFDEFHERSIHADTALAFSLEIQAALRDDLTLLVMSATLDEHALSGLLPEAAYVESHGRAFPVETRYAPMKINDRLVPSMVKQISNLMLSEQGSLLAFLPGVASIKQVEQDLYGQWPDVDICPLYGQLSPVQQQQAIQPASRGRRKIVLATNIAETSLTIEGITIVVDSGLERVAKFNLKTGVTKLEQVSIAQSSAEQRAGRAGRLEAGTCVRLYSESHLNQQPAVPEPEILHTDLAPLALELLQWGTNDVSELSWLDTPPVSAMSSAFSLLNSIGLTTSKRALTSLGTQAQHLGIDPRHAAMLLKSKTMSVEMLNCSLAAIALIEEPERSQIDLKASMQRLIDGWHVHQKRIEHRIRALSQKCSASVALNALDQSLLGHCLSWAYPDRIAQSRDVYNQGHQGGQYLLANGHGAQIDDSQRLAASDYLVVTDLMRHHHDASQIFLACELTHSDLPEELQSSIDYVDWDDKKGRLIAEQRVMLGGLILSRKELAKPDSAQMTEALTHYVKRKGLSVLPWNEASTALLERLRCAVNWLPEQDWPDVSKQGLLEQTERWLTPYMAGIKNAAGLKKIDLVQALNAYLGWPLNQELDKWLPTHYTMPTGSRKRIRYQAEHEPILSVRMQEVFGEQDSPLIALGRKKVVLELLSPAQRPLQITQDLAGFWQGAYNEVKKEMKGRYPKHVWPDDPANHLATTKTKRQLNS
ncbi:ATP-dependent helicase HrpB [Vibrio tapetis]|uniref:ATP-dependent (RNA) helicase n=1 Tax=Vibrio tapetis subsp. tapetis TaxID=1671868 RepID=A0A2N8Z8R9_9VIBR|nr:ATP-dependent helicase HrpB [Vibrio tapetis]SON48253.1 ATP-dependent (RNA) helicase [Vibrio tapetis subsp. tapetis]